MTAMNWGPWHPAWPIDPPAIKPPYLALYAQPKTTFRPSDRVCWRYDSGGHGSIVTALWNIFRKEHWVMVAWDGGSTEALAERQVLHLPFQRGPTSKLNPTPIQPKGNT